MARALANNAIVGVTEGFTKDMDLVGVGYKADVQGKKIVFALGYSHPVEYVLPDGIEAKAERVRTKTTINQYQTTLTLSGIDKQMLGQVAAELNRLRKPDAYKGKGIRYADKFYRLKPGKPENNGEWRMVNGELNWVIIKPILHSPLIIHH